MNAENTHSKRFALQLGRCWPQNVCIVWESAIPLIIYWNSHGLHVRDTFWPPSVSSDRRNGQNLFPDWCMIHPRLLSFCSSDIIGVRQSRWTRLVTGLLKAWPPNPVCQFRAERINYHTNALPFNQIVIKINLTNQSQNPPNLKVVLEW